MCLMWQCIEFWALFTWINKITPMFASCTKYERDFRTLVNLTVSYVVDAWLGLIKYDRNIFHVFEAASYIET